MRYGGFEQLIAKIQDNKVRKKLAVVAAEDIHTLEAVILASKDNIVDPVFIGHEDSISKHIKELGVPTHNSSIVHCPDHEEAAQKAVELVKAKEADFIMKGLIETAVLMRVVLNKENGLRTGAIMSHLAFLEIPTYHKLIVLTDTALNIYPDLEQKKQIIANAVSAMKKMGIRLPKTAVLAAVEEVNPKMPETVDAYELKKMNEAGEIKDCIVEGPISYDLAIDKEAAVIKGYDSPVAGDADLLVAPNITAGNLLGKSLVYSGNSKLASFVTGAKVPIVLTSRSSSTEDKYLSLVVAASGDWRE